MGSPAPFRGSPGTHRRSEDTLCDNDTPHGDNPSGFGYILRPLRPGNSRARLGRAAVPGRPVAVPSRAAVHCILTAAPCMSERDRCCGAHTRGNPTEESAMKLQAAGLAVVLPVTFQNLDGPLLRGRFFDVK